MKLGQKSQNLPNQEHNETGTLESNYYFAPKSFSNDHISETKNASGQKVVAKLALIFFFMKVV